MLPGPPLPGCNSGVSHRVARVRGLDWGGRPGGQRSDHRRGGGGGGDIHHPGPTQSPVGGAAPLRCVPRPSPPPRWPFLLTAKPALPPPQSDSQPLVPAANHPSPISPATGKLASPPPTDGWNTSNLRGDTTHLCVSPTTQGNPVSCPPGATRKRQWGWPSPSLTSRAGPHRVLSPSSSKAMPWMGPSVLSQPRI